MFKERKRRSLVKTISWRIVATCTTILIVYVFTGRPLLAISVGGVEIIVKMLLYFLHERVWDQVSFGKKTVTPFVLWFTGLSGAGKSTLANKIADYLRIRGVRVEQLDGDKIRELFPKTGFSKEERDRHIKRIGFLASMLEKNGVVVVSSFISPYAETRNFVRKLCGNFVEVYVATPLEVCEARDAGLYKKARVGEIKNFTGISDPYEEPVNPDIILRTDTQPIDMCMQQLIRYINRYIV